MPAIFQDQISIPSQVASTCTATTVAAAITSTLLLAANTSRKYAIITNTSSNGDLYIDFDGTASTLDFSIKLAKNQTATFVLENFTGAIHGIWNGGTSGGANVREFT